MLGNVCSAEMVTRSEFQTETFRDESFKETLVKSFFIVFPRSL